MELLTHVIKIWLYIITNEWMENHKQNVCSTKKKKSLHKELKKQEQNRTSKKKDRVTKQ